MNDLGQHVAKELRRLGVRVDWRATFEAFCELHGGMPVKHGGRLLFADGWGHALDYRGPEFPPPKDPDELRSLKLAYLRKKVAALKVEAEHLGGLVGALDELAMHRSAPLQLAFRTGDVDGMGNPAWGSRPLKGSPEMEGLRDRLRSVREELARSEPELWATEQPAERETKHERQEQLTEFDE